MAPDSPSTNWSGHSMIIHIILFLLVFSFKCMLMDLFKYEILCFVIILHMTF